MPRIKKHKPTLEDRLRRVRQHTVRGYKRWIDPFPTIHGTLPEKMVYAELSRRGIPFLFLNDLRFQIPELEFDKEYQADFVLPDHKIIIEVQGAFWHSKPKTLEADAFKFAIYETLGYRVLAWWDFDILARLPQLFAEDPQLTALTRVQHSLLSGELPVQKRTKVDTSKGIRTLNMKRGQRLAYKKKPIQIKGKKRTVAMRYLINAK